MLLPYITNRLYEDSQCLKTHSEETEHVTTHVCTSRNCHCKIQLSLMCAACRVWGGDCWTRGSLTDRGGGSIIHRGSESASHCCRVRRSGRMILVVMRADLDGVPLCSFHPPHQQKGHVAHAVCNVGLKSCNWLMCTHTHTHAKPVPSRSVP